MLRLSKFALVIAGLTVLLASGPGLAGPPPCITSDAGDDTACGSGALQNNTGTGNSALGGGALQSNTSGGENTASGANALISNTTGDNNTASGQRALFGNTMGSGNTASGDVALSGNATGNDNTASGVGALFNNTTGNENTALGFTAGELNFTGSDNTFVGAGTNPSRKGLTNGTALGQGATLTRSNSIVLGNTDITAIFAKVTSITGISDRRDKKDIAALDPALGLALIAKLKPVSYRFKGGDETDRYGFIAQDLEEALPARLRDRVENAPPAHGLALIERENDAARTYRVSYGELTAPLVKAIQEQQAEISTLAAENAELRTQLAAARAATAARLARVEAALAKLAPASPHFTAATLAPAR